MRAAWVNKPLENRVRRELGSLFRTLPEKHSLGSHLKIVQFCSYYWAAAGMWGGGSNFTA